MNATGLAKSWLLAFERFPSFSRQDVGRLNEVFRHEVFLRGSPEERQAIMLGSSLSKYEGELQYPWDNYFGFDLAPRLRGMSVLDLGCFTGGRSIAWYERYGLHRISGLDVEQTYIDAARQFAAARNAHADFRVGTGEAIPFAEASFDAILSFDVFEHVRDLRQTLAECRRVLKEDGLLCVVFPSFYHPLEHHLSLASMAPCAHWLFARETLHEAYCEILAERGPEASWYRRTSPQLEPWEKGHTINGTTFARFKELVAAGNWAIQHEVHAALGSVGRNAAHYRLAKWAGVLLRPLTYLPGLQEALLHRITFVLRKRKT